MDPAVLEAALRRFETQLRSPDSALAWLVRAQIKIILERPALHGKLCTVLVDPDHRLPPLDAEDGGYGALFEALGFRQKNAGVNPHKWEILPRYPYAALAAALAKLAPSSFGFIASPQLKVRACPRPVTVLPVARALSESLPQPPRPSRRLTGAAAASPKSNPARTAAATAAAIAARKRRAEERLRQRAPPERAAAETLGSPAGVPGAGRAGEVRAAVELSPRLGHAPLHVHAGGLWSWTFVAHGGPRLALLWPPTAVRARAGGAAGAAGAPAALRPRLAAVEAGELLVIPAGWAHQFLDPRPLVAASADFLPSRPCPAPSPCPARRGPSREAAGGVQQRARAALAALQALALEEADPRGRAELVADWEAPRPGPRRPARHLSAACCPPPTAPHPARPSRSCGARSAGGRSSARTRCAPPARTAPPAAPPFSASPALGAGARWQPHRRRGVWRAGALTGGGAPARLRPARLRQAAADLAALAAALDAKARPPARPPASA
eukprot:tig00000863_g4995.t1